MYLLESFKAALQNVRANKMRSFLTMLGIIIGISSVITIVSIGQGGKNYLNGQFENIGTNIVNISITSSNSDIRSGDYFTLDDVSMVKEKVPKVNAVIPLVNSMGTLKTENKSKLASIIGTTGDYLKLQKMDVLDGRFLNQHDADTQRNVAVIDDTAALKLFRTTNAVGKKVTVNMTNSNITLTVIGVIKNPAGDLAAAFRENMPGYVFMPITIADRLMGSLKIGRFSALLSDMTDSKETSSKILRLLEVRHRNTGKYGAEEGFKELDTINNVLNMFTTIIGAIAGISLLVGGIGVMNIMLVSVTERTREIGIRKALGATMKDIRLQFLTESLIICLVGGSIGMALGISVGFVISKFINLSAAVSLNVVMISFLFSSAVGIFFGLYPANKAGKLDPIEALRYE